MPALRPLVRPLATFILSCCLLGAGLAYSSGSSRLPVVGDFTTATPGPGWKLSGTATLTAASLDKPGEGLLRLTGNQQRSHGQARFVGGSFWPDGGLILSFSYVSWGGGVPGADGIVVFLYDAAHDMSGGVLGGGLGFCQAAGAYLALALDEHGNFSDPGVCPGGGGPGRSPQSVVLRGPTSAGNPHLAHGPIPGDVDDPSAPSRPALKQVILTLTPRSAGSGYTVDVDLRPHPAQPLARVLRRVVFPYDAPQALSVGVAGATGGAKNIHEVRHLAVSSLRSALAPRVQLGFFPSTIPAGGTSTMVLALDTAAHAGTTTLTPVAVKLPGDAVIAEPLRLAGTCLGTARAEAGGNVLVAGTGTRVHPGGCTVSAVIRARSPGAHASAVGAGEVQTDLGLNTSAAAATLTVAPLAR